jgi:YD repeat-containing protein
VTISHYGYTNDRLGLRTAIGRSGIAFGSAFTQTLDYNDRNELTSSTRNDGGVYARRYTYDQIGNRSASSKQVPPVPSTYFSNGLDQYCRVETQGGSAFFAQG